MDPPGARSDSTSGSPWQAIAARIHASGRQIVIAVTGGGSGAISALLQTPGASRSVLEAIVPYSLAALIDWIGGKPDQACSEATARAMAMAAFMRARKLAPDADVRRLVGVGCTASLASDRPKRGQRRIHAAVQGYDCTEVFSLPLTGDSPMRDEDEQVAASFALSIIAQACGVDAATLDASLPLAAHEPLQRRRSMATQPELTELLLYDRWRAVLRPGSAVDYFNEDEAPPMLAVFPGAFNPPHSGHLRMASLAEERLRQPVTWELSIRNVDKPPLDFIAIEERVRSLRREDAQRPIALTGAATFRMKAALFPKATFVVGVDTIRRIAEPRYYADSSALRDKAIDAIERQGCRFVVFGREVDGQFMTLGDLELPEALRRLCDEVTASEFRADVSSTELRRRT
jgi:nicotinic acid mononucleotide adenylyltransferase